MTWAVWRDPSGSVGVTRFRDVTEAAASCKVHGCTLLDVLETRDDAQRRALDMKAKFRSDHPG